MEVDWNDKDIQKWLQECRKVQEDYYKFFGRYNFVQYKPREHKFLKSKIGFALFGGISESDDCTGYTEKQWKLINQMFELIQETKEEHRDKKNIWASFLYVCCKIDDKHMQIPVIRVPKYDVTLNTNADVFIDSSFRVYENWQDFLDNNKLPECLMCYPSGGKYFKLSDELQLETQVSPEGRIASNVLKGFDITTAVIQFATVGATVASLFVPFAWPVLVGIAGVNAATGSYVAGRGIAQLVDRKVHKQTIGLESPESRNCYLGIVGSALGIVSGGAIATAARAAQVGESIAIAGQVAVKSITATSCAVNSLGVVNGFANIIQKVADDEEVTGHDIFYVTSSVLFFANSVVSTYQANVLIKSNNGIMSEISNLVNKSTRSVTGIGDIVHVDLPGTVGLGCASAINTPLILSFYNVCKDICGKLFEIAQKLWQNEIPFGEYKAKVGIYFRTLWDSFNEEINMVIEKICDYFGIERWSPVLTGGCDYVVKQNPDALRKIARKIVEVLLTQEKEFQSSLEITSQNYSFQSTSQNDTEMDAKVAEEYRDAVMKVSKKLAEELKHGTPEEFIRYLKFTGKFIRDEFMKQKQNYEKSLQMVNKFKPDITVETFDREYGIETNRNQYFLEQTMKDFKDGNGFSLLRIAYEEEKKKPFSVGKEAVDKSFILGGDGNFTLLAIEDEEGLAPDGWLNRHQYFGIAEKLTKEERNETNTALQEDAGTAVMFVGELEKFINVTTQKQDDMKISGIALMLPMKKVQSVPQF